MVKLASFDFIPLGVSFSHWECMTSWISCVLPCFNRRPYLNWPNSYNRFSVLSHDIQLHCIINAPNNERSNGSIRQCLTTGPHAYLQWKSSAAKLFLALPTTESQKGVSILAKNCNYLRTWIIRFFVYLAKCQAAARQVQIQSHQETRSTSPTRPAPAHYCPAKTTWIAVGDRRQLRCCRRREW